MLPSTLAHSPKKQHSQSSSKECLEQERTGIIFTKFYLYNPKLDTWYISLILLLLLMWKVNQQKNC